MSRRATEWAWKVIQMTDLKPASSLVLLALAQCHFDDTGRCDPSNALLRKMTGLSERGVRDGAKECCDKGIVHIIYRQARTGRGKRNLNNRYAFRGGAKFAGGVGQNLPPLRDNKPTAFFDLIHPGDDSPDAGSVDHLRGRA